MRGVSRIKDDRSKSKLTTFNRLQPLSLLHDAVEQLHVVQGCFLPTAFTNYSAYLLTQGFQYFRMLRNISQSLAHQVGSRINRREREGQLPTNSIVGRPFRRPLKPFDGVIELGNTLALGLKRGFLGPAFLQNWLDNIAGLPNLSSSFAAFGEKPVNDRSDRERPETELIGCGKDGHGMFS